MIVAVSDMYCQASNMMIATGTATPITKPTQKYARYFPSTMFRVASDVPVRLLATCPNKNAPFRTSAMRMPQ